MIKAIETKYKGYRFRSRLEARWAVFFDALEVKWEYEPEGYDLGDGNYYLPDFKVEIYSDILKNVYAWIEIKATEPNESELKKCTLLRANQKSQVYLLSGTPGEHEIYRFIALNSSCIPKKLIGNVEEETAKIFALEPDWYMKINSWDVSDAIESARSARFEHGENQ